jgi:hypothetical protein
VAGCETRRAPLRGTRSGNGCGCFSQSGMRRHYLALASPVGGQSTGGGRSTPSPRAARPLPRPSENPDHRAATQNRRPKRAPADAPPVEETHERRSDRQATRTRISKYRPAGRPRAAGRSLCLAQRASARSTTRSPARSGHEAKPTAQGVTRQRRIGDPARPLFTRASSRPSGARGARFGHSAAAGSDRSHDRIHVFAGPELACASAT